MFACVWLIAKELASAPLFLYEKHGDRKKKAVDNPIYTMLHDSPNPEMSSQVFREAIQSQVLLWGNGYAEILRSVGGDPLSLWPLESANMTVKRINNELVYEYHIQSTGETKYFPSQNILHIPGLSFNGIVGKSVIGFARETIGTGMAMDEFGARYFSNSATPRGILEHPKPLGEEAQKRLVSSFNKTYLGLSNAQKIMLLEEGMTFKQMSFNPQDSQFLESKYFQIEDICRFFSVPPHLVQHLLRATYSNIEHQTMDFWTFTLRPWAIRWEQQINLKLLNNSPIYYVKHMFNDLVRADLASRTTAYASAIQNGWLSINEVRGFEELDPVEGGDAHRQQQQMIDITAEPEEKTVPEGSNGKDDGKNGEDKERKRAVLRELLAVALEARG